MRGGHVLHAREQAVTEDPLDYVIQRRWRKDSVPQLATDLELLMQSEDGFRLALTPLQRAICRAVQGKALAALAEHPDVIAAFGGVAAVEALARLHGMRPAEVVLLAAIRCGKSMIAAGIAICASQTCDVSMLSLGDELGIPVVSTTKANAHKVYSHVRLVVEASSVLRSLLVGEPTAETVMLRHPSGRPVAITCTAGARAGGTLVGSWLLGCIFDEAPRMLGSEDGAVVNLDDARRAVLGRMLPGAQIVEIGSPWAPSGPVYELTQACWGKPTDRVLVIRARGPAMNPVKWTPEECERMKSDPQAYKTDVCGEFADPEEAQFPDELLQACTTHGVTELPPGRGIWYSAAIDPASRTNSWTLVVVGRYRDGVYRIAKLAQWTPQFDKPLRPGEVLDEIAELVRPYPGAHQIATDQWSADAIADLARERGLTVWNKPWDAGRKVTVFGDLKTAMQERRIVLLDDAQLRDDLKNVRRVTTQQGVAIRLVATGRRHADYAPALALAHEQCTRPPTEFEDPPRNAQEAAEREGARLKRLDIEAAMAEQARCNREFLRHVRRSER